MKDTKVYGYARVSTKDQCLDRQIIALKDFGIDDKDIYLDKISGKDFKRPKYRKMVRRLKEDDVLVVMSIDRLGRNYEEILEEWRLLTKKIKAQIVVLDMPLLDTRQKDKDLTGVFLADMVLQILSYVAETERSNIRKRQEEGIIAAKKRGVIFGRPKIIRPDNYPVVCKAWLSKNISSRKAAVMLGVSQDTFLRWARSDHGHPKP